MSVFRRRELSPAKSWILGIAVFVMLAGFVGKALIYGDPLWVGVLMFVAFWAIVLAIGAVVAFLSSD